MKVTILGCGGSGGVPTAGGDWGRCDPSNSRNYRTRSSILVQEGATTILVDTSPDLRTQLLAAGSPEITSILYTHAHADHTHGFDDVRFLKFGNLPQINVYSDAATVNEIQERFPYAFRGAKQKDGVPRAGFYNAPPLVCHIVEPGQPITIGDVQVTPFVQRHGKIESIGYRFNDFAYSTDAKFLDEDAFTTLTGVKTWVVEAACDDEHPAHAHVALALEWIARVKPARAYLTHMNYALDYADLLRSLPAGVEPAYDGLSFSC